MIDNERTEWQRLVRIENAIGSAQMEGLEAIPSMRELLDQVRRDVLTKKQIDRAALDTSGFQVVVRTRKRAL